MGMIEKSRIVLVIAVNWLSFYIRLNTIFQREDSEYSKENEREYYTLLKPKNEVKMNRLFTTAMKGEIHFSISIRIE